VVAVLLVVVGPVVTGPTTTNKHCYHHAPMVKPEADTAIDKLLMMRMRMSETCCAVFKRLAINLRD
jgi:hypothetical protein